MRFQAQTEEEINKPRVLLNEGEYDFNVISAEDKISQKGNEYIALKLQVWDDQGNEKLVFTNLAFIKLLKHFCDVTGLSDKYQNGEILAEDCLYKSGRAIIKIQSGQINPNGGYYPDKNIVGDYVVKNKKEDIKKDYNPLQDIPF